MTSVEAHKGAAMVRGRTAGIAYRQTHEPAPLCKLDPAHVREAARSVRNAVKQVDRSRNCGVYVFVSPAMQVFAISEERSVAQAWIRERFAWLVGFYVTKRTQNPRIPWLRPTLDGIDEDLRDHMKQNSSAAAGRKYGGSQPAGGGNSRHPMSEVSPRDGGTETAATHSLSESGEGPGHD